MIIASLAAIMAANTASISALTASQSALSISRRSALVDSSAVVSNWFSEINQQQHYEGFSMQKIIDQAVVITQNHRPNVSSSDDAGLPDDYRHQEDVRNLIKEGWQPLGPVLTTVCGRVGGLMQTMVKYEEQINHEI